MGTLERLTEAAGAAFRATPVVFAYLYGSVATGRAHARSDVDVAVYLDGAAIPDEYLDYSLSLAQRLATESGVGFIEVLVLNEAPLTLRGRVIQTRVVLFSRDEPARVAYESLTLRQFFDFDIHARALDMGLLRHHARRRRSWCKVVHEVVDPSRVRSLLDRLSDELAHLARLAGLPSEELSEDSDLIAAVKYRFVVATEICIDLGEHVVSSEGLRAPSDFADVFASLAEGGLVPRELASVLQEMARFRNLLVHGYMRVDDSRVVGILKSRLRDLDSFGALVAALAEAG